MSKYSCIAKKYQVYSVSLSISRPYPTPFPKSLIPLAGCLACFGCGSYRVRMIAKLVMPLRTLLLLFFFIVHLITDLLPPFSSPLPDLQPRVAGTILHLSPPCGNSHIPCPTGITILLILPIERTAPLAFQLSMGFDHHILPLLPPPRRSSV